MTVQKGARVASVVYTALDTESIAIMAGAESPTGPATARFGKTIAHFSVTQDADLIPSESRVWRDRIVALMQKGRSAPAQKPQSPPKPPLKPGSKGKPDWGY